MKYLKFLSITFLLTFLTSFIFAQTDNDTTEYEIGKSKIIIIKATEEIKASIEKLEDGIIEFQAKINLIENKLEVYEDSLKIFEAKIEKSEDAEEINLYEKRVEEYEEKTENYEDKKEAFEEGIDDIEDEIYDLSEELEEINEDINDDDDDYSYHKGHKKRSKKFRGHWSGLEFGINNYLNSSYEMNLPAGGEYMNLYDNKSYSFSLNFIQFSIPLFSKYIGLVTGLGVEWNNYYLKENIDLFEDANNDYMLSYTEIDPLVTKYTKNIFKLTYLNVPLLLEFQIPISSKGKRLNIGFGVIGGLNIQSKFKKVWEEAGEKQKKKLNEDYQVNPFQYEATARFGYGPFQLFANYSFAPLFEDNKGPELYPFTAGLRLNF